MADIVGSGTAKVREFAASPMGINETGQTLDLVVEPPHLDS